MNAPAGDVLVERFLHHLANERRLSPRTIDAYRRDLADFSRWNQEHEEIPWSQLRQVQIRNYAAARHRQGLSGRSLQRRLSALRSFFRYLVREGHLKQDPAQGVRAPKSARKLPATLDVDQVDALLTPVDDDPLNLRDSAMLELLYSSGLRLAELVSLDLGDLDLREALVEVTGKGAKTRRLPVGRMACAALSAPARYRHASTCRHDARGHPAMSIPTSCATPSPATCSSPPATCGISSPLQRPEGSRGLLAGPP